MAFTVTTLVNASVKPALTPVKVANAAVTTLQTTTASVTLFGKLSAPAVGGTNSPIILYYAIVPYDGTDGIQPQTVSCANELELKWGALPGQFAVTASLPVPAAAGFLHTWLEIPNLPFAATVTITAVESTLTLVQN